MRKAIVTLGRQPESEVIILAPSLHAYDNGEIVPFEDSKYVWVESIMKKQGVIPNGTINLRSLPACDKPLDTLITGLQGLTQSNFSSAVFVLGK